jgi:STE24 endopeptidase
MPYYAGFLIASIMVLWMAMSLLLPDAEYVRKLAAFPLVAVLAAYIFLVFGFLSRRCERQADIYGCRAVSCGRLDCAGHDAVALAAAGGLGLCPTGIRTFINALEKVARLNGISRDRPGFLQSWLHSTIARRVEFLQHMQHDATLEPRFQRKVALVKWGLLLGLGAAMVVLVSV